MPASSFGAYSASAGQFFTHSMHRIHSVPFLRLSQNIILLMPPTFAKNNIHTRTFLLVYRYYVFSQKISGGYKSAADFTKITLFYNVVENPPSILRSAPLM